MNTTDHINELEKQIQELKKRLSDARRELPPVVVNDYTFTGRDGNPIKLSELFAGKKDLLVVHNMGRSCPYCTLWADGFIGFGQHLQNRAGFVLVSPDDPEIMKAFSESRGWTYPVVSSKGSTFTADMGFFTEADGYWPGVSAFRMEDDGTMTRVGWAHFGPGDDFCAVWPLLDLLQGGAGEWEPKYKYSK